MDENIAYKKPDEKEITQAKALLLEYVNWLNQDLCFQNIHEELEHFPEKYSEPDGSFIIATENDTVVGCVGLKKLDDGICEMKRLFVTDTYKRIRIVYIDVARKRPEEFEKRLNHFISKTKENKKIAGFGGIEKYY
jgi:hypothetical protein